MWGPAQKTRLMQTFFQSHKMIKVDVKGLIKIENIRIIKKPLNHLTSLIYLTITIFGLCFKVTAIFASNYWQSSTLQQEDMFMMN